MILFPWIRKLTTTFSLFAIGTMANQAQAENYENWGVGYGMSYAYLGASIDYRVVPNLYLTGAIGSGINEVSLAAGGRYYVLPSLFETARARVSVVYGPYSGVTHTPLGTTSKRNEQFNGFAVGMGMVLFSDNEGFDLDFFYTNTRAAKHSFERYNSAGEAVSLAGLDPISISLGYRRRLQ